MTPEQALRFVETEGVVLASAKGPIPRMTEIIAGEPIKGGWWGHPKGRAIFAVFQVLEDSADLLICRLVGGKVTFVHRRLWPALIRAAGNFPVENLAQVHQEHTSAGRHVSRSIPFPDWADAEALAQAETLSEEAALTALGPWTLPRR
jgi:hypothetical protein